MQRNLWLAAVIALALCGISNHTAIASEPSVAEEILNILKSTGQISQDQYDELLTKARDEEASRAVPAAALEKELDWTEHFTWYGDFRARGEHFNYDDDPDGVQADDRTRGRYRARIGLNATVNEYFGANFRLSTGNESTSTNHSLGEGGDNFDKNEVGFDRLFMHYEPYGDNQKPQYLSDLKFKFGKMGAPFLSKEGKDYLFWDGDVAPEGFHGTATFEPGSKLKLTAKAGYFIEDEEKDSKDPHLATVQLIGNYKASDSVRIGAAGSYYQWSSLNDAFFDSNEWVDGGLTDDSSIAFYDVRTWI
ncbi:MAG: putative porin, partial [Deltaproteobacteria bacterium]|nr:putative porin [Deltaproteobacteria bacterium]